MRPLSDKWLIVFVKAPVPGQVKTRLLSLLSDEEACQLYRCLVLDTLEAVKLLRNVRVVVAYAADPAFPDLAWLNHDCTMFLQQGETLGERLIHAFEWAFAQPAPHQFVGTKIRRGDVRTDDPKIRRRSGVQAIGAGQARSVVALGSDAPDLSTQWVRQAFHGLVHCDVVVGPTVDGGYQLIGLVKPHPELFVDMPWSSSRLFNQTLDRLKRLRLSVHVLSPIADLDTPDDLHRYEAQRRFHHHTPACQDDRGAGRHTARFLRNFA